VWYFVCNIIFLIFLMCFCMWKSFVSLMPLRLYQLLESRRDLYGAFATVEMFVYGIINGGLLNCWLYMGEPLSINIK
jgi:hypothetical protein